MREVVFDEAADLGERTLAFRFGGSAFGWLRFRLCFRLGLAGRDARDEVREARAATELRGTQSISGGAHGMVSVRPGLQRWH